MLYPDVPSIDGVKSLAEQVKGRHSVVLSSVEETAEKIATLTDEEEILTLTGALLKRLIDDEITDAKNVVESLLSEGLRKVFTNQKLWVEAEISEQRGKVSLNLITKEEHENGSVTSGVSIDSYGGAVTTVQSILMRVITIIQRELRPLILLDESLPAFDPRYIHNMMEFLRVLCERLGFDFVFVTHNKALVEFSDHQYDLRKVDGKATVKKVK